MGGRPIDENFLCHHLATLDAATMVAQSDVLYAVCHFAHLFSLWYYFKTTLVS
jgi:hypothetical protein